MNIASSFQPAAEEGFTIRELSILMPPQLLNTENLPPDYLVPLPKEALRATFQAGRPCLRLSQIFQACPYLFNRQLMPGEDQEVALPYQKVRRILEGAGGAPVRPVAAAESPFAVRQAAPAEPVQQAVLSPVDSPFKMNPPANGSPFQLAQPEAAPAPAPAPAAPAASPFSLAQPGASPFAVAQPAPPAPQEIPLPAAQAPSPFLAAPVPPMPAPVAPASPFSLAPKAPVDVPPVAHPAPPVAASPFQVAPKAQSPFAVNAEAPAAPAASPFMIAERLPVVPAAVSQDGPPAFPAPHSSSPFQIAQAAQPAVAIPAKAPILKRAEPASPFGNPGPAPLPGPPASAPNSPPASPFAQVSASPAPQPAAPAPETPISLETTRSMPLPMPMEAPAPIPQPAASAVPASPFSLPPRQELPLPPMAAPVSQMAPVAPIAPPLAAPAPEARVPVAPLAPPVMELPALPVPPAPAPVAPVAPVHYAPAAPVAPAEPLPLPPAPQPVAAPEPAPEAEAQGEVTLRLASVLRSVTVQELGFDATNVPDSVTVNFPISLIRPQLATGKVQVGLDDIMNGVASKFLPAFARASKDLRATLPLSELFHAMPQEAIPAAAPAPAAPPAPPSFETLFQNKASEDATRIPTPVSLPPLLMPKAEVEDAPSNAPIALPSFITAHEDLGEPQPASTLSTPPPSNLPLRGASSSEASTLTAPIELPPLVKPVGYLPPLPSYEPVAEPVIPVTEAPVSEPPAPALTSVLPPLLAPILQPEPESVPVDEIAAEVVESYPEAIVANVTPEPEPIFIPEPVLEQVSEPAAVAAPLPAAPAPAPVGQDFQFGYKEHPAHMALRHWLRAAGEMSPRTVVGHVTRFPGVRAAAILGAETHTAGEADNVFFAKVGLRYESLKMMLENMGQPVQGSFTMRLDNIASTFFMEEKICLAVLQDEASLSDECRDKLTLVTRELAALTQA